MNTSMDFWSVLNFSLRTRYYSVTSFPLSNESMWRQRISKPNSLPFPYESQVHGAVASLFRSPTGPAPRYCELLYRIKFLDSVARDETTCQS